jgi:ankyrin repeat protein
MRPNVEQPFRTDIEYYEDRAEGIATVNGVSVAEAKRDLARRRSQPARDLRRARSRSRRSGAPSAAQAGQEQAVDLLLELGADPEIRDALYEGTAAGWAAHGCRPDLAERLG